MAHIKTDTPSEQDYHHSCYGTITPTGHVNTLTQWAECNTRKGKLWFNLSLCDPIEFEGNLRA